MKITVAKSAGFCFGVSRAVEGTFELIEKREEKNLCTLGELIHNPQIVQQLKEKNVRLIENPKEAKIGDAVIIRSHGVEKAVYEKLKKMRISYVDFTCPYVKKIHYIVESADRAGDTVFIVGHENHPEVVGIKSYARNVGIFSDIEQLEKYTQSTQNSREENITVVVQTTFDIKKWKICRNFIEKYYTNAKISDTICKATQKRQEEAELLSAQMDACFVVGGRESSNTNRLAELCKKNCESTYFIEAAREITTDMLSGCENIGITAGASTPGSAIEDVFKKIQELSTQQ